MQAELRAGTDGLSGNGRCEMKDYSAMSDFDIQQEVLQKTWGKHPVRLLGKMMLDIMLSDYDPCNNTADAWPIVDENNISIISDHPELRIATSSVNSLMNEIYSEYYFQSAHENGLRAAMIVYLQMMEAKA